MNRENISGNNRELNYEFYGQRCHFRQHSLRHNELKLSHILHVWCILYRPNLQETQRSRRCQSSVCININMARKYGRDMANASQALLSGSPSPYCRYMQYLNCIFQTELECTHGACVCVYVRRGDRGLVQHLRNIRTINMTVVWCTLEFSLFPLVTHSVHLHNIVWNDMAIWPYAIFCEIEAFPITSSHTFFLSLSPSLLLVLFHSPCRTWSQPSGKLTRAHMKMQSTVKTAAVVPLKEEYST